MHKQSPGRGGLRGRIVNVSSIAGHLAIGMMGGYCASKFALRALTTAMDQELRHFGIRASLVEPGRILTRFGHRALAETEKHATDRGPYGGMYRRWDRLRINEVGGKPDVIARHIRRACLARRPRFHYLAPWDAKSANLAKRLLPDSWLNRAIAGYIQPRRRDREPRSP
jgi:NAD(P)-dependent dehydrogenase (short-subunit alcohol dehydrogenase family)